MRVAEHIKASFHLLEMIVRGYLEDLSNGDLLVRPHPQCNHIAWQLGHLIVGENFHIGSLGRGPMPALPTGFVEQHNKAKASSDDPADFATKQQYLDLMEQQRNGTLAIVHQLDDEQLAAPAPEALQYFGPTLGAVFSGEAIHWTMHAGQWAVIRRILGKPPLF